MGCKLFCTLFSIKNFSSLSFKLEFLHPHQLFRTPFLTYNYFTHIIFSAPNFWLRIFYHHFPKIFPPSSTFSYLIFKMKPSPLPHWIGENGNGQYHFVHYEGYTLCMICTNLKFVQINCELWISTNCSLYIIHDSRTHLRTITISHKPISW